MKIIALDIGDVHTGVAYADDLAIIAIPYKTVATKELKSWLSSLTTQEPITTIIVGYPKTLKGTESKQTKQVVMFKEQLEKELPSLKWILLDERLTSKQAQSIMRLKPKSDPQKEHAIAAAIILQTYLESLQQKFSFKH